MLVASSIGMLVKSTVGIGYPLVAIPIVASTTGLETAVVAMTLPTAVSNVLLAWRSRHALAETSNLAMLAVTAVIGTMLGTFVLVSVSEQPLVALIVLSVLLYGARVLWFKQAFVPAMAARRATPVIGLLAGLLQGVIGMPGPLLASWLNACGIRRNAYILSLTSLFLIAGVSQLTTQVAVGAYNSARLTTAAVALVPVVALLPVGERLRRRLSDEAFDLTVLGVLAAAATLLCIRALT